MYCAALSPVEEMASSLNSHNNYDKTCLAQHAAVYGNVELLCNEKGVHVVDELRGTVNS